MYARMQQLFLMWLCDSVGTFALLSRYMCQLQTLLTVWFEKIQRSSGELRQFTGFLEKDFKEEVVWKKVSKRDVFCVEGRENALSFVS